MGDISINRKIKKGENIKIKNGEVMVDDVDMTPISKTIIVSVEGNLESLIIDELNTISINGNVNNLKIGDGEIIINGKNIRSQNKK